MDDDIVIYIKTDLFDYIDPNQKQLKFVIPEYGRYHLSFIDEIPDSKQ